MIFDTSSPKSTLSPFSITNVCYGQTLIGTCWLVGQNKIDVENFKLLGDKLSALQGIYKNELNYSFSYLTGMILTEVIQDLWAFVNLVNVVVMSKLASLKMKNSLVFVKMVLKVKNVIKLSVVQVNIFQIMVNHNHFYWLLTIYLSQMFHQW